MLLLITALELFARSQGPEEGFAPGGALGWTVQAELEDFLVRQPPPREDFLVSTNEDGLRTESGRLRPKGSRRLMTFGDSTIFGWGLPPEEAPAAALGEALGAGWEVINAGQPAYSSEQARRLAESAIEAYSVDGVVWFHPWHDVAWAEQSDRSLLPEGDWTPPWWTRSQLLAWIWSATQPRQLQPQADPLFPFAPEALPQGETTRVPLQQRRENLARVVKSARARDAWVVVVLLPNDRILEMQTESPLARELRAQARELGVPFVDTLSALSGEPLESVTLPGDPGHFTGPANRRLMAPVVEAIRALDPGVPGD